MRNTLCLNLVKISKKNDKMIFLTGDLGYKALEPLQSAMKKKFINAGVSEQNMISVSAGLAKENFSVWCYSIAPFIYARPFEQIRNDICFHNLPVKIVGNGGGYGYGVMGPTHHAIEDYGVLLTLPKIKVYVPIFNSDLNAITNILAKDKSPAYLRLGIDESPKNFKTQKYKPWRKLISGNGPTVISIGSISGTFIELFLSLEKKVRPNFWVVTELPLSEKQIPKSFIARLKLDKRLIIIEEHVKNGSFANEFLSHLIQKKISIDKYKHHFAINHIYSNYGSDKFMRKQSKLDDESIIKTIKKMCI